MRPKKSKLRTFAVAGAALALVASAGCSKSNGSTPGGGSASSGGASQSTGSSGVVPTPVGMNLGPSDITTGIGGLLTFPQNAAEAKTFVAELTKRPTSIVWNKPLTKPIPKGKTIAVLELGVPAVVNIDNWIQQAATAIGWNVKRIPAGVTAESFKAAMDQAVADHPDAVMLTSFPRGVYESELTQLQAMHVPVVAMTAPTPTGGALIATLNAGTTFERLGQVMAAQVAAATGGKNAKTLLTMVPTYTAAKYEMKGFQEAYPVLCPGCSYSVLNFDPTDIGTKVPGGIADYLQAHPDVNQVVMQGTFMGTGTVAALRAAGILNNVRIYTFDLDPPAAQDLKSGVNMTVTSAVPAEFAVRGVDVLIRYLSGDPTWKESAQTGEPEWIITKDNLPSDATKNFVSAVPDLLNQYRALWGVK